MLLAGADYYQGIDWDYPVSLIMAAFAYLSAPWSLRVIIERRWKWLPAMLLITWWSVDGCYWLYWRHTNPLAVELMREVNFPASLSLYGMCGLVWLYRGSLRELARDARRLLREGRL